MKSPRNATCWAIYQVLKCVKHKKVCLTPKNAFFLPNTIQDVRNSLTAAQRKGYTISEIRYSVIFPTLSDNKKTDKEMGLFIRKSIEALQAEAKETGSGTLKRVLGPVSLVALGVGVIIGAGLFSITGTVAASYTGPAITLSFIICSHRLLFCRTLLCRICFHDSGIRGVPIPTPTPPWENLLPGLSDGT